MSINYQLYKAPTSHLNQEIERFNEIIFHAESRILDIKRVKNSRKAMAEHRKRLNALAEQYISYYDPKRSKSEFIAKIRTILTCDTSYAEQVYEIIRKRVKSADTAKRNQKIVLLSEYMDKTKLARKFNLSRQQIHNIINDNRSTYF
jgi:mevalonate kinase